MRTEQVIDAGIRSESDGLLTGALLYPRGDHDRGNSNPESIKLEIKRRWSHNPVRTRDPNYRCSHVIVEPTMLVVCDY